MAKMIAAPRCAAIEYRPLIARDLFGPGTRYTKQPMVSEKRERLDKPVLSKQLKPETWLLRWKSIVQKGVNDTAKLLYLPDK
jgi:hypothetical protein